MLTEADDGREVRLAAGSEALLRLSNRWQWSDPALDGEAVEAIRVAYESNPGYSEWQLRARRAGRVTLTAEGRSTAGDSRRLRLVLVVD